MGLRDSVIPTETIDIPGSKLDLRGLDLPAMALLIRLHGEEMKEIFSPFIGSEEEINLAKVGEALLSLPPSLVGQIIALAADEPELAEKAAKLPATCQIEALEKIVELTFRQEGGLPKFVATITRIFEKVTSASNALQLPSKDGSAISEVS